MLLPLFDSPILAMASVLLYAEVTHYYGGQLDFEMARALCGSCCVEAEQADYLFFDTPEEEHFEAVKTGTPENPEKSATCVFYCKEADQKKGTRVALSGPGIDGSCETILPVTVAFIAALQQKNEDFPMGIDVFFITEDMNILGLPRTTTIEVIT